ncbi:MAG: polyprenyl synthetase family protein [Crocinitomicaceae bacterium]
MSVIDQIIAPVQQEMVEFENKFRESMHSDVAMLDKVTHYIIKRKGKQVRPLFVFLTAKMLGNVTQKTYDAATLVELLHTATLVHDDVVDDANERRGYFSINALWKNKVAVLVGDYMLSKILLLSIDNNNTDLLEIVARSVKEMSEGELLQIEKARLLDITEEIYFEVIRKKTASLISTCCESAVLSIGNSPYREKMRLFGEYVGIAFQIKDDIFDYGMPGKIGKPTGIDIRERKLTLPIIYTLNNSSNGVRKELINIIKNQNENSQAVQRAVSLVKEIGGIDYSHNQMTIYANKALELIKEIPENEAKKSLELLVDYTMNREK